MGIKQKHNPELDSNEEQGQWCSHTGDVSECLDPGGQAPAFLAHLSSGFLMVCLLQALTRQATLVGWLGPAARRKRYQGKFITVG
jgi:hypothetical protein